MKKIKYLFATFILSIVATPMIASIASAEGLSTSDASQIACNDIFAFQNLSLAQKEVMCERKGQVSITAVIIEVLKACLYLGIGIAVGFIVSRKRNPSTKPNKIKAK